MTGVVDLCQHVAGLSVARVESFEAAPNISVETVTVTDASRRRLRVHSTNRGLAVAIGDGNLEETTEGRLLSVLRSWMRLGLMCSLLEGRAR